MYISLQLADEQETILARQLLDKSQFSECIITDNPHDEQITSFIDARGLACPQPLLQTKKALKQLQAHSYLYLVTTDPHSLADIQAFAHHANIQVYTWQGLIHDNSCEKVLHFLLKNDSINHRK